MTKASLLLTALLAIVGCGTSANQNDGFKGARWKVDLVRLDSDADWIRVQGDQEWWFFKRGVFRQISDLYVEPQFYGPIQACSGTGNGVYTNLADAVDENGDPVTVDTEALGVPETATSITLNYDDTPVSNGLCRMTDRVVHLIMQPSGDLDILDNRRVQRLRRVESID